MNVEDKTQYIMAVRNLNFTKKEKHQNFTDTTASDTANKKILLRSIEPQSGTGYVGVDEVKNMTKLMRRERYDTGILISRRFTVAAVQEMAQEKIQLISDEYMPHFDAEKLYLTITNCINNHCQTNCGKVPQKKSECKEQLEGKPCKVKALSDNSSFHFEHGWIELMQNDLKQLLSLNPISE